MKFKRLLFALAITCSVLTSVQAGTLTTFSLEDFIVEYEWTTFPIVQPNANNLYVEGTDFGDQLSGSFNPGSIHSLDSVYLTATLSSNPNTYFAVHLYNSNFEHMVFNGWLNEFGVNTSTTVKLLYVPEHQEYDPFYDDIIAFEFFTGGMGGPLAITFESLNSIVPEPHTYALIVTGLLAGGVILRRKRQTT